MNKLMIMGAFTLFSFALDAQEVEKVKPTEPATKKEQAKPSKESQKASINKQMKKSMPRKIEKAEPTKQK